MWHLIAEECLGAATTGNALRREEEGKIEYEIMLTIPIIG